MAMKIKVNYFGRLAELAGTASEQVALPAASDSENLLKKLEERHPLLKGQISALAINGEILQKAAKLHAGDEADLFPPFAGG